MQEHKVTTDDRTLVVLFDHADPHGSHWWADGRGSGKCWLEGSRLIIGGYKIYGAAHHHGDDHPDACAEMQSYLAVAASLQEWAVVESVVLPSEFTV